MKIKTKIPQLKEQCRLNMFKEIFQKFSRILPSTKKVDTKRNIHVGFELQSTSRLNATIVPVRIYVIIACGKANHTERRLIEVHISIAQTEPWINTRGMEEGVALRLLPLFQFFRLHAECKFAAAGNNREGHAIQYNP